MPRPLTPEQLARRAAEDAKPLQEVYEAAVKKALTSSSASERTQALAQAGAMLTPTLGELRAKTKELEDAREVVETALKTSQDALAAANAKVVKLEPLAAQLPDMTAQYAELKANFDSKIVEARKELLDEATQERWRSERARNEAEEKLREANNTVAASGWRELRATLADLIICHGIPQPDFWETSATMPSAFWELWAWSPAKAKVYTAFKAGYKEPSPAFRAQLLSHLKATLPLSQMFGGEPPAPIENLSEKIACMTEMAQRWNVWTDIEREFTRIQIERQAETLRTHYAAMHSEEQASAQRGEGRTPIGEPEPESSVPVSEHLEGCVCKICSPGLKRPGSLDALDNVENF